MTFSFVKMGAILSRVLVEAEASPCNVPVQGGVTRLPHDCLEANCMCYLTQGILAIFSKMRHVKLD